ncbi:MAG TPA: Fe-S cluster assembly protein SufD [Terriglobales bacterium]|nr:Fe-S cluster assembly protein SufD [Terriglobales bacterium]
MIETRTEKKQAFQAYLDEFEAFAKRAPGADTPWMKQLRQEAFARFWELGFPTLRDEDWRFTSLAPLSARTFRLASGVKGYHALTGNGTAPVAIDLATIHRRTPAGVGARVVFVNGRYAPELSKVDHSDVGRGTVPSPHKPPQASSEAQKVVVMSLAEAIAAGHPLVQQHLAKHEDYRSDAFTALNTAFVEDGAFIHVKRGAVVEAPIYVLYVSVGNAEALMAHPRNLIVAEEQSQATVVEDYVSLPVGQQDGSDTPPHTRLEAGATLFFSNVVTEVVAGQDALLSHYMIEREDESAINVSTLHLQQARNANVDSHSVLIGGGLVRNNVHPVLTGEGADCLINGLFVANGRQHMDNYMKVEHAAPHCNSRQFYNGILDGQSRGVFHGRIIVHKDAQKTDAKQTNRNLLLSDGAQIDTKPQLEIYADDVKCTHGATIGQMDEEALFYMRSRGIAEQEARRLMLFAFASECLDRMKPGPVRSWLEESVGGWLPGGTQAAATE